MLWSIALETKLNGDLQVFFFARYYVGDGKHLCQIFEHFLCTRMDVWRQLSLSLSLRGNINSHSEIHSCEMLSSNFGYIQIIQDWSFLSQFRYIFCFHWSFVTKFKKFLEKQKKKSILRCNKWFSIQYHKWDCVNNVYLSTMNAMCFFFSICEL